MGDSCLVHSKTLVVGYFYLFYAKTTVVEASYLDHPYTLVV